MEKKLRYEKRKEIYLFIFYLIGLITPHGFQLSKTTPSLSLIMYDWVGSTPFGHSPNSNIYQFELNIHWIYRK